MKNDTYMYMYHEDGNVVSITFSVLFNLCMALLFRTT